MTTDRSEDEYVFRTASASHTAKYLWPTVLSRINKYQSGRNDPLRAVDLGCGAGAFTHELNQQGYDTIGVDASESGIKHASQSWPNLQFHVGSVYDDLSASFGQFDVVVSLEVVEHLYDPRRYAQTVFDLLVPGGLAVISTPFHGYWKNLLLAVTGKLDSHFTALWDHGHIKFWSVDTLTTLLDEREFEDIQFDFVGRRYPFSKSMIAIARKPLVGERDDSK